MHERVPREKFHLSGRLSNVASPPPFYWAMADTASTQPNTTLYINNLNDKINKEEIRFQLYALFTTYGKLIDVVATKTPKMRGQAFLVFTDLASATAALRACDGLTFYDKPMVRLSVQMMCGILPHARSAKSVFHMQRANPTQPCAVRTPTLSHQTLPMLLLRSVCERLRNPTLVPSARRSQMRTMRRWTSKMTMRRAPPHRLPLIVCLVFSPTVLKLCNNVYNITIVHSAQVQPSNKLQCSNLPQEVTNGVLAVLFQQYVSISHSFIIRLTNSLGTGVFRRRRSNRPQNPMPPEKRSKQQKLSLRTRSLRQLQDRC